MALWANWASNRMSVGVQDFDERVQQAGTDPDGRRDRRCHPERAGERLPVHFIDLIYGLPKQTVMASTDAGVGSAMIRLTALDLQLRPSAHAVQAPAPHCRA